ncbi:MAG: succinate dehydrogenase, cytochrome b556 subunit [Proteobacteria bacterium]|nr:succinate dehydrogenase, cytochrome b556 subunit [Pseudomonadota bacterium]
MATRERPLSPHLQIYKWQAQMLSSILHRATGMALAAGSLLLVCGLVSLSMGPDRWAFFTKLAGSIPGLFVLLAFTWALSYHLINGVRHLLQDGGLGFAIPQFVRSSLISMIGSVVLTATVWGILLARWGQP